jgi:hypothetical protein
LNKKFLIIGLLIEVIPRLVSFIMFYFASNRYLNDIIIQNEHHLDQYVVTNSNEASIRSMINNNDITKRSASYNNKNNILFISNDSKLYSLHLTVGFSFWLSFITIINSLSFILLIIIHFYILKFYKFQQKRQLQLQTTPIIHSFSLNDGENYNYNYNRNYSIIDSTNENDKIQTISHTTKSK